MVPFKTRGQFGELGVFVQADTEMIELPLLMHGGTFVTPDLIGCFVAW
jgi:hypothetical protein